jgi:hypothetical protein
LTNEVRAKYLAFPIEGDSMPPHTDGSFIIGRLLEDKSEIKNGKTYILLTLNDGIVYKRVQKKDDVIYTLISDNSIYEPYDVWHSEVLEIWEFACSIALKESDLNFEKDRISAMFLELQKGINQIVAQTKRQLL